MSVGGIVAAVGLTSRGTGARDRDRLGNSASTSLRYDCRGVVSKHLRPWIKVMHMSRWTISKAHCYLYTYDNVRIIVHSVQLWISTASLVAITIMWHASILRDCM